MSTKEFLTDIVSQNIIINNAPSLPNHGITKNYVESNFSTITNLNLHTNNSSIHFKINDGSNSFTETFSANYSTQHFDDTDKHIVVKSILNSSEIRAFYEDSVRNKLLSTDTIQLMFGEVLISSNDWLKSGVEATGNRSHLVVPNDATIIGMSASCENDNGSTSGLRLYRNNTNSVVLNFPGVGQNSNVVVNGLDIDVTAGTRIRVRGETGFSNVQDTTVYVYLKFRG